MYIVWLRERYPEWQGAEWFGSDINGSYEYCRSQIRALSLDMHYKIQIREI